MLCEITLKRGIFRLYRVVLQRKRPEINEGKFFNSYTLFDKQSQNKTKASVLFALTHPYRCVKINILTFSLAQKSNKCKCYYTKDIKTRIYNIQARASSFSERQSFALFGCRERMCGCASFFILTFKKIQTVKTTLLATQNL